MGYVGCMKKLQSQKILVVKSVKTGHFDDLGVNWMMILKCILRNKVDWGRLDSSGSGQWPVASSREHGYERLGSIKAVTVLTI